FIDGSFGDEFSGSAKGPGFWPYPGVAVRTGIPALCRAAQTLKQRVSIQLAFRHGFSPQLDNAGGDEVEVLMGVLAAKRLGAGVGLVVVALQAGALIGLVGGCVVPFRDDGNLIGPAYLAATENPNVLTDFHAGTVAYHALNWSSVPSQIERSTSPTIPLTRPVRVYWTNRAPFTGSFATALGGSEAKFEAGSCG